MLLRKFSMCSGPVKCSLFRTYITPLYTSQLWSNFKKRSMQRLKVAYNDAMRLLLGVPRWHSASPLYVFTGVSTCEVLLRQLMYGFMCRLEVRVRELHNRSFSQTSEKLLSVYFQAENPLVQKPIIFIFFNMQFVCFESRCDVQPGDWRFIIPVAKGLFSHGKVDCISLKHVC